MWKIIVILAYVSGHCIVEGRRARADQSGNETSSESPTVATGYLPSRRERPQPNNKATPSTTTVDSEEASLRLPNAAVGNAKPTKYHYFPHNQHIYLLPECAIQQVCNAVYVRLNYTQPLCACPSRYREPCSASLNADDLHTTELATSPNGKVLTLVKTCEPVADMRICRAPRDWSLLALQNIRTGKSHYLVICRCPPETSNLEGPMSHDQPTYASVPGIRVYGMMCVSKSYEKSANLNTTPSLGNTNRRGRPLRTERSLEHDMPFPWDKVRELVASGAV
ncbi:hypothetical protein GE061_014213 [Apolygus lucorum]|uniref:Uncharacterized protein n=1 Tax=Apolygus lucorum TaxID=248454 RepID=A0A6A4K1T9_APOLU|nr:hypothetical protein GE061_014213 [Apolygus lucorum]